MAQTSPNVAIWVNSDAQLEIAQPTPANSPGDSETLVSVSYSGINPADVKHGVGLGVRDTVAGYDFSGTVLAAGPNSKFAAGQTIAGCTPTGVGRPATYGTHQNVIVAPDYMTFAVPAHLPLDHAACLAVSARTAADAFFNLLQYPLPRENAAGTAHPAILIWGGAASLGFMTIQFARAIGVQTIFATASPANHAALRALGATQCFDYRDPAVAQKIRDAAAARGAALTRIFDAVGAPEQGTAATAAACGADGAVVVTATPDGKHPMPLATRERDVRLKLPGSPDVRTMPAQPEAAKRALEGLEWAVENYGSGFKIPNVQVLGGDARALKVYLEQNCAKGASFRKVCVEHPLML